MSHTNDYIQIFDALGDKTRFRLLRLLAEKPGICVSQLASELSITPACVSQHMRILSDARLVRRVRTGQRVCYEISSENIDKTTISEVIFNTKEG